MKTNIAKSEKKHLFFKRKITPLHRDPKQQELRVLFKASFDQGPYGGFFYRTCKYKIGFIDLATENVNIALVL